MTTVHDGRMDPAAVREAFACFPSGVVALAAEVDGVPEVMVASSFATGISLEPPLVAFAAQRTSATWPRLARATRIGISVLGDAHSTTCRQLAARDRARRFDGVAHTRLASGAVVLHDAAATLECTVHRIVPAGDHDLVLLEPIALGTDRSVLPLIFHHSALRSLPPKE
ncbi:flavin reductase family protein [Actinoplanes sp. RD1]|uniref:flavin reductase family protein n=1 Tax=Actinoplanes sp. RD1 TaxID=3064538 RepID=UPI0027419F4D|nr:flavin reductase family protein [Actinoplanes sp. RD1]